VSTKSVVAEMGATLSLTGISEPVARYTLKVMSGGSAAGSRHAHAIPSISTNGR
jgi:hypothetical protein